MRDLTDQNKISVRSIPEAMDALERIVAAVKRHVRWRTWQRAPARPGKASCVNALVLWFERQTDEAKRSIMAEGHRLLDEALKADAMDEPIAPAEARVVITPAKGLGRRPKPKPKPRQPRIRKPRG